MCIVTNVQQVVDVSILRRQWASSNLARSVLTFSISLPAAGMHQVSVIRLQCPTSSVYHTADATNSALKKAITVHYEL